MAKEFEDVRFKMFEKKTGELSEADRQKLVRARKSKIKGQSQKVLKDMVNRKFKIGAGINRIGKQVDQLIDLKNKLKGKK